MLQGIYMCSGLPASGFYSTKSCLRSVVSYSLYTSLFIPRYCILRVNTKLEYNCLLLPVVLYYTQAKGGYKKMILMLSMLLETSFSLFPTVSGF